MASIFQSTPPVKAATLRVALDAVGQAISIHAAREGGDSTKDSTAKMIGISIHAAREGGDMMAVGGFIVAIDFNPRRP